MDNGAYHHLKTTLKYTILKHNEVLWINTFIDDGSTPRSDRVSGWQGQIAVRILRDALVGVFA